MPPTFEWDERKAASNERKHHISFNEAASAFEDERGLLIADPDHSESEDRFVLLGMSVRSRLLVVCHCDLESEDVIRIISARRATARERRHYLEANPP
jgi:uncharacterized DUF497 family protein